MSLIHFRISVNNAFHNCDFYVYCLHIYFYNPWLCEHFVRYWYFLINYNNKLHNPRRYNTKSNFVCVMIIHWILFNNGLITWDYLTEYCYSHLIESIWRNFSISITCFVFNIYMAFEIQKICQYLIDIILFIDDKWLYYDRFSWYT